MILQMVGKKERQTVAMDESNIALCSLYFPATALPFGLALAEEDEKEHGEWQQMDGTNFFKCLSMMCQKTIIASQRVLSLSPYEKQGYQLMKNHVSETRSVDNKTFLHRGLDQLERARRINHAPAKMCRAVVAEDTQISPPERRVHLSRADLEAARPPAADL